MPGKMCTGRVENNAGNMKNSKAFCEGIRYRASGTGAQAPVTDNPHGAGSESAIAWQTGWTIADDAAGGNVSKGQLGCCAPVSVIKV